MGEYLDDLHKQHKARRLRLQQAAFKAVMEPPPIPAPEPIAVAEEPPKPTKMVLFSTFDLIINEVCAYYNVRKLDILSQRRLCDIAQQRHMVAYMLYRMTSFTNRQIADKMQKDPTTISYGIHKIRDNIERHVTDIEQLEKRIGDLLTKRKQLIAI